MEKDEAFQISVQTLEMKDRETYGAVLFLDGQVRKILFLISNLLESSWEKNLLWKDFLSWLQIRWR